MDLGDGSTALLVCAGLGCLAVILVAGFLALIAGLAYSTRKRIDRAWVEVGRQTGLVYTSQTLEEIQQQDQARSPAPSGLRRFIRVSSAPPPSLPGLSGDYRGLPVTIDTHYSSYGLDEPEMGDRFTRLAATVSNPRQVMLEMHTKRVAISRAHILAEPCQSAVESVDKRFYIRCRPTEFVSQSMPALAPYLAAVPGQYEIRLEGNSLVLSMLGLIVKPETFRAALELAVELNRALYK